MHNARTILADYRVLKEGVWERFGEKKGGTLWYYRALADVFMRLGPKLLAAELERTVSGIERLSASSTRLQREEVE